MLTREFATRSYIARYFGAIGIEPRITFEANSVSAVLDAVRSGRHATVLPAAIVADHPDLRILKLERPLPPRHAALLQRKGAYRTAAARAFVEFALHELKRRGSPARG